MAEARARSGRVLGGLGGRTMESGTEEYELNGDLRPGSPGSPDALVRSQHPLPRLLCDLGRRRPLWARLGSGHLWASDSVRAASALRGSWGRPWPLLPGKAVLDQSRAQVVVARVGGQHSE